MAAAPASPAPATAAGSAQLATAFNSGSAIADFYRARGGRPLWLAPQSGAAAQLMLGLLNSASVDGLDPDRYQIARLTSALRAARRGDIRSVERAELMLSQAFVDYARDLRRTPNIDIVYVDRELVPGPPLVRYLLDSAASASSLENFVDTMAWMNPTYGQLRRALLSRSYSDDRQRRTLMLNLERSRALPPGDLRHVVVNVPAQRLYMYENGQVVDSMRVVVGKPKHPTPMMNAFIRAAALNPYWNVPPDLAAERIAPHVVKQGVRYLTANRYQLLSDWSDKPTVVDPGTVDWKAVADGRVEVRIRQLPGPNNGLGMIKFLFPNREGIFLHDTPERQLLSEASRLYSGGCIRLEDAPRFARWLFGRELKKQGDAPEQIVPIPTLVPLYITYLTAVPSGSSVAYYDDVYGRDAARLVAVGAEHRAGR
ncbi:L,D-transpeptidase family protein [Sphingomonas sp.]|uniref:L,D-transpeptidase family protein n=1 Tax=Sphingomonas sp. TaxID=28214 RepID=UPI0017B7DB93|nr:L,D-transpeptidase family protein [Sphingomonas sp.]MBA3512176.1 L,D-transpeptidase family protein [Sphingomonas sp.]